MSDTDIINSNEPPSQFGKGILFVCAAAVLFSFKAIFVKLAYRYNVDVTTLIALRMLFALPFYLAVLWSINFRKQTPDISSRLLLKIGILGCFSFYVAAFLDLQGLQYISVNLGRLIIYLYPTLVIIISALFYKRRFTLQQAFCIAIAYIGISVVFLQDFTLGNDRSIETPFASLPPVLWGSLLTFGASLAFAIYIAGSETIIKKVGSKQFTAIAMIAASFAISMHFLLTNSLSDLIQPVPVYLLAAAIAFFSTVLPSFLMSEGIQHIGSNQAGLMGSIGPVSTLLFGYLILGEAMTLWHVVGMAIILFSVYLLSRQKTQS